MSYLLFLSTQKRTMLYLKVLPKSLSTLSIFLQQFLILKSLAIITKVKTTFTAKIWKMWAPELFKSFHKNQFMTKARQNALCKVLSSYQLPSHDQWQKSNGETLMPVIMKPQAMRQNKVFLPCSPGCSWASSAHLRRSTVTWCHTSAPPRLLSGRTAWWCCGTCGHFKPSPGWSMEVSPRTNLKSQRENRKHGLIKKEKRICFYPNWRGHADSLSAYFYLNYFLYYFFFLSDHTLIRVHP